MGSQFMIVPFILVLWGCGIGFVSSQPTLAEQRLANARLSVGVSKADYPEVINLVTDDFFYQDPVVEVTTRSGYRAFLDRLFVFSPAYGLQISDEVYDGGDTYMCYWKMEGYTDVQLFWFISASVDYSALGMSIVKFRPGEAQIYFQRDQYSEGGKLGRSLLTNRRCQ
jgi:hypothetical protein